MGYPYSTSTGTIEKILTKIQSVGIPASADNDWFSSIGFSKQSEQRMRIILKYLGFIDKSNIPTELWNKFKSTKTGKKVLAKAIKDSYKKLFSTYPDAHKITIKDLTDFFSTEITAGEKVLGLTITTFRNLCAYADFNDPIVEEVKEQTVQKSNEGKKPLKKIVTSDITTHKDLTVNLNIQLTVPETKDEEVYNKFFEAMKKHLLT